jgi:hypothetical protein
MAHDVHSIEVREENGTPAYRACPREVAAA